MYKYQIILKDSNTDTIIGKGYLNLHLGTYQMEVTEGELRGTLAEGTYQTRTDFGLLTHHLDGFSSTSMVMPKSVLSEVKDNVYGELSFVQKQDVARVLLRGNLIFNETKGWKQPGIKTDVAA
ncbi:MAG: hypothetical protein AAFQ98_23725 [Bacteroidota bacterium]